MNEVKEHKPVYKTVKDYAELHGVNTRTIYNWIKEGKIQKDRIKTVLSTTLIRVE